MTAAGDIISMTVHLELKEWPLDLALDPHRRGAAKLYSDRNCGGTRG